MSAPGRKIATMSLVVRDYDEAIAWYVEKLGFELFDDIDFGGGKRWVTVGPAGGDGARLLLAEAKNEAELSRVGDQAGGRVFLFSRPTILRATMPRCWLPAWNFAKRRGTKPMARSPCSPISTAICGI